MRKNILFLLIAGWLISWGTPATCYAVEEKSPALVTPTLEGKIFDIASLRGKVVIIHFWATWCSSCREEMPVLDNFYLQHHEKGIEMLAVSLDRKHDRDDAIAAMRNYHFPASLISDATTNSLGIPGALPVTYIIDTKGIIRSRLTPDKAKLTEQVLERETLPLNPR